MAPELAHLTSPEAVGAALVLVPVGSLEQHGPHLPLETDTLIAEAVARRLSELLPGSVVAPAVAYGSSGEHQDFAGTCSIGGDVLHQVLVELTRSVRTWAQRVVFVNGHGGNVATLRAAVGQLVAEGHDVGWLPCAVEGADAHAGRTETSLLLHLHPERVRLELAEAGNTAPLRHLLPWLVTGGVRAVSTNGVLGDPTGASAEEGCALLDQMVRRAQEGLRRAAA